MRVFFDLSAPHAQQRPQIAALARNLHPTQASGTATAQQAQEHGLGLVVGVVPQGDEFGPGPIEDLVEKGVAQPPTRVLQRQALGSGVLPHVAPL